MAIAGESIVRELQGTQMRQAVQHLLAERHELVVVQHSEMLSTAINDISSLSAPRVTSIKCET